MALQHTLRQDGSNMTVALSGTFTFADNAAFRGVLDAILAAKPKGVTVDLAGLQTIDSAGLSMLVLMRDKLAKLGASATLKHPPKEVARILEVVDFGKLFTIVA